MRKSWWVKGILIGVIMITAGAAIVMLLWNYTLPSITGLPEIRYGQALALLILARILFGRAARWRGMPDRHCAKQIRDKMADLSPEEKEKFRKYWEGRCNKWSRGSEQSDMPHSS